MGRFLNMIQPDEDPTAAAKEAKNAKEAGRSAGLSAVAKEAKEAPGEPTDELEAAGINIAIFEDGGMRVVVTADESAKAIDDGATLYSPPDMWHYVQLEPRERRMLHSFKRTFGGATEWRPA